MSAAEPGRSLELVLEAGPLAPGAGLALADDLLAALEVQHGSGSAHGRVEAASVRVLPDGTTRLLPSSASGDDFAAARTDDVRAAAELVCRALGIPVEWSAAEPLRESERAAPALTASLRALAQGSLPLDAAGARAALREAAGGLVEDDAVTAARAELSSRSGAVPTAAAVHHAPTVLLPAPARSRRPIVIAIGVAAGLVMLGGLGVLGWSTAGRHLTEGAGSSLRSPSPSLERSPSPLPLPSVPTASGPVKSVSETPQTTCEPGSKCRIEVDVHFVKADAPEQISWQFELIDSCTSDATYVQGSTVNAQKGWVHVVGDTELALPAGHPLSIVAITTEPSRAASAPLLISTGNC